MYALYRKMYTGFFYWDRAARYKALMLVSLMTSGAYIALWGS